VVDVGLGLQEDVGRAGELGDVDTFAGPDVLREERRDDGAGVGFELDALARVAGRVRVRDVVARDVQRLVLGLEPSQCDLERRELSLP